MMTECIDQIFEKNVKGGFNSFGENCVHIHLGIVYTFT